MFFGGPKVVLGGLISFSSVQAYSGDRMMRTVTDQPRQSTDERFLAVWTGLLAAASILLVTHPIHEPDVFWHLLLGKSVLAEGGRTVVEPASFVGAGALRVVPEWLWGVLTYGLHELGSWPLLHLLLAALTATCTVAVVAVLRRTPGAGTNAIVLVSAVVMMIVASRIRVRPHAVMFLFLPCAMLLSRAYLRSDGGRRLGVAAGLLGLELIWAQTHGSFVLLPAVFALIVFPTAILHEGQRGQTLALLVALIAGLGASAYGLDLPRYLGDHAAGEAVGFLSEMAPPSWLSFHPVQMLMGPLYVGLWLLALAGMIRARRLWFSELGLAVLGLLQYATAIRFIGVATLLIAPLALRGAQQLRPLLPGRATRALVLCVAALLMLRFGARIHEQLGPLGTIGPAEGQHPATAAAYIRTLPPGIHVLGDLRDGAPLAFWLDGRAQTYLDTRTPLHFDDTDFGMAREAWMNPDALERTVARYDVQIVVTARHGALCGGLGPGWVPVAIEPMVTTFSRAPLEDPVGMPLTALSPCGEDFLTPAACSDGGRRLYTEIAYLDGIAPGPFVHFLYAERIARCGGETEDARAFVPPALLSRAYAAPRDRLLARLALADGDLPTALAHLDSGIRSGSFEDLAVVAPALLQAPPAEARPLLEAFVTAQGDRTPPDVRADLAWVCSQLEDADCVRTHALRAAVRGSQGAVEPLRWLKENHPDEAVREDARAWLGVLGGA